MSQAPVVIVPKYSKVGQGFSKKEIFKSFEHPGRRTDGTQSAASWIGDLSDLKKCILLCSYCRRNFNHKKNHYRLMFVPDHTGATDGFQSNGQCDACKQQTANCGGGTAYVHESYYARVCVDPSVARRSARAAAKAWSVSNAINRR